MSDQVPDKALFDLLAARGYDVSSVRKQPDELSEDSIRRLVDERLEEQRKAVSPEDAEREIAERFRNALNESRSKWYGGEDDAA
jgi:hypothetical protein